MAEPQIILDTFVRGIPAPMIRHRTRTIMSHGKMMSMEYFPTEYPAKYPKGTKKHGLPHPKAGQKLPWAAWRDAIKQHIRSIMRMPDSPADGPLKIDIQCFFPREGDLLAAGAPIDKVPCDGICDNDNLEKLIFDALGSVWEVGDKAVGIWTDDRRICDNRSRKFYPRRFGGITGANITVMLLKPASETPSLFPTPAEAKAPAPTERPELVHPRELLNQSKDI